MSLLHKLAFWRRTPTIVQFNLTDTTAGSVVMSNCDVRYISPISQLVVAPKHKTGKDTQVPHISSAAELLTKSNNKKINLKDFDVYFLNDLNIIKFRRMLTPKSDFVIKAGLHYARRTYLDEAGEPYHIDTPI